MVVLLLVSMVAAGCARHAPPAAAPAPTASTPATAPSPRPPAPVSSTAPPTAAPPSGAVASAADPVAKLRLEIDETLGAPALAHAQWAALVESLDTGEVLYRYNAAKLMMPASNMKILTLAVAAERLGWDFQFETTLASAARLEGGVLGGDLIVGGGGDPTINARGGERTRVFEGWAQQLREAGIRRIDGRVIGDDDAFEEAPLGAGWAWDYLDEGYAAPVGALQFNEDLVDVVVTPGADAGRPASVELRPSASGLTVVNHVQTVAAGSSADLDLRRLPGQTTLEIVGSISADRKEAIRTASVENPTLYFAAALREALIAQGIAVRGEAADIDDLAPADRDAVRRDARVLLVHRSEPLAEIAKVLMKVSQNLYAETLLRMLAAPAAPASVERGRAVVREVLASWGVPDASFIMYDGSGLSRYNYVTAETLVTILRRMQRDARHRERFVATLPIGGEDGTLRSRMRDTRAAGNARAKTGSIANVRALSGYVSTMDGERLVFSILANHFNLPVATIDAVNDRIVERLANFSRQP